MVALVLQRKRSMGASGHHNAWAWSEFKDLLSNRKIAGKTLDRLKTLIWLAAHDVKSELAGREAYEYQTLASLVGVTTKNWSETFTERWVARSTFFYSLIVMLYCL